MNLDDFEEQIDPKIVDRGYGYFIDDHVEKLELFEEGAWLATVRGTESYRVELHADPANSLAITDWRCDCPYDYGPVCKHVVAVLYALAERDNMEPDSPKKREQSTVKDNIREIFNNSTREDLEAFILDCIKWVDGFENRFMAHFADHLDGDPARQYRGIIRNYAKAAQGRSGFIDYRSAPTLTRPLWALSEKADALLDAEKTAGSMALCQILIEEVAGIIKNMDDSDGGAGDVVMLAFDTLGRIARRASSDIKEKLFEWCMQEFPRQKYHDFGFDSDFLELLPHLVSTSEQEKQFFVLLDRQIEREKENQWSDYGVTRLVKAKITCLRNQGREQEVLDLLEAHIRFPDLREQLVERALEDKAFEEAKKLCREGIEIAKNNSHRGIITRWQEKLFQIARLEQEVQEIRKWAETLFFNSYGSMQWYSALKSTYTEQEWPEKCEELIDRIRGAEQRGGYGQATTLANIFAEEKYADRLLKILQLNAGQISFVDHYAGILEKEYPYELLDLYEQGITEQAQQTGRKQYREVADWLKKMKRIRGGDERAYALFTKLLQDYSNRPAMKEEFEKAFPEWKKGG